jgi:hypothetical protein
MSAIEQARAEEREARERHRHMERMRREAERARERDRAAAVRERRRVARARWESTQREASEACRVYARVMHTACARQTPRPDLDREWDRAYAKAIRLCARARALQRELEELS